MFHNIGAYAAEIALALVLVLALGFAFGWAAGRPGGGDESDGKPGEGGK